MMIGREEADDAAVDNWRMGVVVVMRGDIPTGVVAVVANGEEVVDGIPALEGRKPRDSPEEQSEHCFVLWAVGQAFG